MSVNSDLKASALRYAEDGVPVFPCRASGDRVKAPLTQHGYKDATTNSEQIREWWTKDSEAAIGIPTGAPWYTVLDVDVRPDGDGKAALDALRNAGLLTGCMRIVHTPSGGLHLYFPGNEEGSHALSRHHLDLKGVGGYVIAPPSRVNIDGEWGSYIEASSREGGHELDWRTCAAVLSVVETHAKGGLAAVVEQAPVGGRNSALYWAARRATEIGAPTEPLRLAALRRGLAPEEVTRTIENGVRAAGDSR